MYTYKKTADGGADEERQATQHTRKAACLLAAGQRRQRRSHASQRVATSVIFSHDPRTRHEVTTSYTKVYIYIYRYANMRTNKLGCVRGVSLSHHTEFKSSL